MKRNVYILFSIFTLIFASVVLTGHPVTASTTTLKLNKTKLTVKVGRKKSLKIKGSDKKLKWITSNAKVVTISPSGIVTGIKKGTATVTATAGKQHAICKITVIGKNDYSSVLTEKKIRKWLHVPQKAKITIKYGKTFYKKSFCATLVPVEVYEHGKKVAGASFFVRDGELGCNVGQYGAYH